MSDTESSIDTIKVHTSHTRRVAAAVTYSAGERKNNDSNVKTDFVNAAGDVTWIPRKDLTVTLKYRHYEVTPDAPSTVSSVSLAGQTSYTVRDPIGYTKDIMSAVVRYRASDALTLRGEFAYDDLTRDITTGIWQLDQNVSRTMMRLGASYLLTRRITVRGDVTHQTANLPSDSVDNTYNDTVDTVRASLTWAPKPWYNLFLAGATIMEKRYELAAPFTGPRETERDRVQASMTFMIGKQTALIPGYAFYQNKQNTTIANTDATAAITAEGGVPYAERESRGILEVVQETFLDKQKLQQGQIEYVCVHAEEGAGKTIAEMRKVRVVLTRERSDDHEIQERLGESAMRRVQILRMTEEAYDKGGLLTQEDLGRILGVSSRTIRRDVEVFMQQNLKLYLRGLQRDIGKGISHKVWIVRLYLEQKTYSEIERITGHTAGSIKIYLSDFSRVLMAKTRGVKTMIAFRV